MSSGEVSAQELYDFMMSQSYASSSGSSSYSSSSGGRDKYYSQTMPEQSYQNMIDELDSNGDGTLSYDEASAIGVTQEQFNAFDTNE